MNEVRSAHHHPCWLQHSVSFFPCSLDVLSSNIHKEPEACNLGIIFNSELSVDAQVTKVLQSCPSFLFSNFTKC